MSSLVANLYREVVGCAILGKDVFAFALKVVHAVVERLVVWVTK